MQLSLEERKEKMNGQAAGIRKESGPHNQSAVQMVPGIGVKKEDI